LPRALEVARFCGDLPRQILLNAELPQPRRLTASRRRLRPRASRTLRERHIVAFGLPLNEESPADPALCQEFWNSREFHPARRKSAETQCAFGNGAKSCGSCWWVVGAGGLGSGAGLLGRPWNRGGKGGAGDARWRTIGKEAAWPLWQVHSGYGGTVKRGAVYRPPCPRRVRDKVSNDGDANETLCGPRWMSGHRSRDHGISGREVARSWDVADGCAGTHAFAAGGTFALDSRPAGAGKGRAARHSSANCWW
jgi:hypothetical protein